VNRVSASPEITRAVREAVWPSDIWEVTADSASASAAIDDALVAIRTQALPWFERNRIPDAAFAKLGSTCWLLARDPTREPDRFFSSEDLFAALAIRMGRADEALSLFDVIAARSVSAERRADHDREETRRQRRIARSKRPLVSESVPLWHDGAVARQAALAALIAATE
jgi:hypothetical protein